jgi:hypothetical protein
VRIACTFFTYLREHCSNPNGVKDGICVYSLKDVPLAVNFSRVKLVEQGHHDESVEDDGEMRTDNSVRKTASRLDVQNSVP